MNLRFDRSSLRLFLPWLAFCLILIPGILLRIFHLIEYAELPLLSAAIGPDVSEYRADAMRLLAGEWFSQKVPIHAPLYGAFLALLMWIADMNDFAVRILQSVLLMVLTALPLFLLARGLVPEEAEKGRRRAFFPFLAVLFLTLYPPLAVYQCELVSEPLMIALTLWGLFFASRAAASQKKALHFLLAGFFCALGALTHPFCLLFCAALFLLLLLEMRRTDQKISAKLPALFLLPFLLLVLPLSLHYSILAGRPVLIQANSGFNYYLGNRTGAAGTCTIPPGRAWEKLHANAAAEAAGQGISADTYFLKQAFHGIVHHPVRFAGLLGKKAALALSGQEFTTWSDIAVLGILTLHRYFWSWCFSILLLLGLPAMLLGLSEPSFRSRAKWFLVYFAAFYLSQILLLTAGRYRLPLTVPLCITGAYLLCFPEVFFKTTRRSALFLVFFFLTGIITFFPFRRDFATEGNYAKTVLAESYLRTGSPEKAEELLAACGEDPLFRDRRNCLLGEIMLARGDPAAAELWFRKAIRSDPHRHHAYMNLGTLYLDAKRWKEALAMFEAARPLVHAASDMADLDYNTGRLHHARGEFDRAEACYQKALSEAPTHRRALNNLGALMLAKKDYAQAAVLFRRACALEKRNEKLRINLALAYFLSGRKTEAEKELLEALRLNPESKQAKFLLEDFQKN